MKSAPSRAARKGPLCSDSHIWSVPRHIVQLRLRLIKRRWWSGCLRELGEGADTRTVPVYAVQHHARLGGRHCPDSICVIPAVYLVSKRTLCDDPESRAHLLEALRERQPCPKAGVRKATGLNKD